MGSSDYDIISVGGGLGGSALAKAMAEHGQHVLILERENSFKDRVRGEFLSPWGVAEASELGIYELIRDACGVDAPITDVGFGPRDLPSTTPQQLPALGFCHPEMQEVVLSAAQSAGAETRRGVTVTNVELGSRPTVTFQDSGSTHTASAKLVVAADGRNSAARKWAGFEEHEKPQPFFFAGLLMQGVAIPEDHSYLLFVPPLGMCTAMTPAGRVAFARMWLIQIKRASDYRVMKTCRTSLPKPGKRSPSRTASTMQYRSDRSRRFVVETSGWNIRFVMELRCLETLRRRATRHLARDYRRPSATRGSFATAYWRMKTGMRLDTPTRPNMIDTQRTFGQLRDGFGVCFSNKAQKLTNAAHAHSRC